MNPSDDENYQRLKAMERYFNRHIQRCTKCKSAFLRNEDLIIDDFCRTTRRFMWKQYHSGKFTRRFFAAVARPMLRCDVALLRLATRFSHWLQQLCGLTSYFIARMALLMTLTCIALRTIHALYPFLDGKNLSTTMMLPFYAIWLVLCFVRIRFTHQGEDQMWKSSAMLNPNQHTDPITRVLWTYLAALDYLGWYGDPASSNLALSWIVNTWFSSGIWIFSYFIAVIPRPPGPTKIGAFFRSLMPHSLARQEN